MDKIYYVYNITNSDNDKVYIGSTCNLQRCFWLHNYHIKNPTEYPMSQYMAEIGPEKFTMSIIQTIEGDKLEARKQEQIEKNKIPTENLINAKRVYVTPEQKAEVARQLSKKAYDKNSDKKKQYYQLNKETIIQKMTDRYVKSLEAEGKTRVYTSKYNK